MRGASDRALRDIRISRSIAYELAVLIRQAYHDPNKFLSYDEFMGEKKKRSYDPEELQGYLMALSQRPKTETKTG